MDSEVVGDQAHVTFTDDGPPADIDLASVARDQFSYRCDDQGNQWTLISKRFG